MYTTYILVHVLGLNSSFESSIGFLRTPLPLSSLYFTWVHCFIVMIFCLGRSVMFLFTLFLFLPDLILPKGRGFQISFSGQYLAFGSSASRC